MEINNVRAGTTLEQLAKIKPAIKENGKVRHRLPATIKGRDWPAARVLRLFECVQTCVDWRLDDPQPLQASVMKD